MNKGKKNQKQEQPAITQEDKQTTDPFLRALAKKVRNLNKKIADIETLEKREDLKPEQQEKINSKPSIIEQRKKYQQFAKFYKTTLAQANKEQSTNQLTPVLSKLSNAIITAQYLQTGATLGSVEFTVNEKNILSHIGNIGAEESNLKNLTSDLSSYLGQYLDNQKLVTKLEQAFSNEDLLNTNITLTSNSSNQIQTKVNTHQDTPKKQHKSEKQTIQTQQVTTQQLKQPIVSVPTIEQTSISAQVKTIEQPTQEVNNQTNNGTGITQPTIANTSEQNKQTSTNEVQQQEERRPQRNNQYSKKYDSGKPAYKPKDEYRQNGNRNGGYREGGYKNYRGGDRKYDKPKYQEKQEQEDDRRSDTSLEDSEDEANKRRKFNNKQINSLQNDGFIVVQKRPKANEQQQYNKKQHGYKDRKPVYNH